MSVRSLGTGSDAHRHTAGGLPQPPHAMRRSRSAPVPVSASAVVSVAVSASVIIAVSVSASPILAAGRC